jgi:hypothetical protein
LCVRCACNLYRYVAVGKPWGLGGERSSIIKKDEPHLPLYKRRKR